MPINAGIKYFKAKDKYDSAVTDQEKMAALQEMLSAAPSHKGADVLRKDIKNKLAELREKIAKKEASRGRGFSLHVKKEGAGQIVLVGATNSGKSFILRALTNADVLVAPYPFTTQKPEAGMANYKGVKIQLVEVPGLTEGMAEGRGSGGQLLSIIRNSDAIVVCLNGSNSLAELRLVRRELAASSIKLNERKPDIRIKSAKFGGMNIVGESLLDCSREEVIDLLKNLKVHNVDLVVNERAGLRDVANAFDKKLAYKKALIVVNGVIDKRSLNKLRKEFNGEVIVFNEIGREEFEKKLFFLLDKKYVYTKKPGEKPDFEGAMVIDLTGTIEDIARHLHKDFSSKRLKARVWGSTKYAGQMVSKDYKPENGDIIEFKI